VDQVAADRLREVRGSALVTALRIPLRDRARNRWRGILPALGLEARYLNGKNGPCPLCPGGRDRWRFLDTGGNGTWICNQCGAGAGVDLVMRFHGLPFKEAAQRIERVLGVAPVVAIPARDREQTRRALRELWCHSLPVSAGDATDQWLRARGVGLDIYPRCLRTGQRIRYQDDRGASYHPAMLAMVTGPDNTPITIHRAYLTHDGRKAAVANPRKLFSAVVPGASVRLTPPAEALGIAEGIETALAASKVFGIPTWAAICTNMLAKFEPPPVVKRMIIFGDNDPNGVGQGAAYALASRMASRMSIEVRIPQETDTDWNDLLRKPPAGAGVG
jgi:putative DNA primase/helicase